MFVSIYYNFKKEGKWAALTYMHEVWKDTFDELFMSSKLKLSKSNFTV